MGNRSILFALAAAALPSAPALAQDARDVSPSDFRLPPGDEQQAPAEGPTIGPAPVRPAVPTPTATPTSAPRPAPTPTEAPPPQRSVEADTGTSREQARAPQPSASVQDRPVREQTPAGEAAPQATEERASESAAPADAAGTVSNSATPAPPPEASSTGTQTSADSASGFPGWLVILGVLIAAMAGWFALRRRGTQNEAQDMEVPRVEPAKPAPAPASPQPADTASVPGPAKSASRQPDPRPQPALDPSSLVSIRPRSALQVPAANRTAQPSGLVSTNLAAKRRAEAEAVERARQQARERSAPARPVVKGSIKFDWS